ncbi:putative holin-like toxin [uncultured Tyzzerella sp.]|nr:putative holin-like toxin [uncultured Tyzzerella sp.]
MTISIYEIISLLFQGGLLLIALLSYINKK